MSETAAPSRRITEAVTAWPGVEAGPGRRGEFAFRIGKREIGHLHGDRAAHFGFPPDVGARLRAEGRVGPHPVAPEKTAWAARAIESDDDVSDVIALLRLNYDRAVARFGVPLRGIVASRPQELPFAPGTSIRGFVLERAAGDVAIYSVDGFAPAGVTRQLLNHHHEALFVAGRGDAPLFVHERERAAVERAAPVRATFSRRHRLDDDLEVIPTPGHTPGATAFLWDSGEHRMLFTGDTLSLRDGEWVAAVLGSSDRGAYLESLALIRELDFDVLVPWAATAGEPWHAHTDAEDRRRRIDAVIERVGAGEER